MYGYFPKASMIAAQIIAPITRPIECEDVLAVIVLFNRKIEDVPSVNLLESWMAGAQMKHCRFRLQHCLIYDNSPIAHAFADNPPPFFYFVHDPSNGGTRAAYLKALQVARQRGCNWILFLDHDTDLPADLFQAAAHALATTTHLYTPICAVVPLIFDGPSWISPTLITTYGRVLSLNRRSMEIRGDAELTAISSAALVRVDSLEEVLPIPTKFSLDYLDHWLFRAMQNRGEHIVISSARVAHSLSLQSMRLMSIQRYRAVLSAELLFLRGTPEYAPALHLLWLLLRALKLLLTTRRLDLVGASFGAALNVIRPK